MARAFGVARIRSIAHVHIELSDDDYRWAFRRPPHAIVTCAEFLVKHVERALPADTWRNTRIHAVPNSVDMHRFHPGDRLAEKRQLGAPLDRPLIVMAANLAQHKGQITAITATANLRSLGVDAELWLAGIERGGAKQFTAQLEALVRQLKVEDRVRFLGQRSDMPAVLRAADAFVLPSTNEGLPLTILEAQASGVPVLAAPTAGIPEVVKHGETGFLIPHDDPAGYARQLHELFRQPALAERLNAAAAARLRLKHTSQAMLGRLREIYAEVLR
jgi:glycosyltransferase involved in cell wall biosynthesis